MVSLMGAHSAASNEYAARRLAYVVGKLNPLSEWHSVLSDVLEAGATGGTLKGWINEGAELATLQLDVQLDDADAVGIGNVWVPSARIVDGVAGSFFTLNGSRRDFAGVVTFAAHPNVYVGFTSAGNDRVGLIVYRVLS
jgi:hypothetical protein